MQETFVCSGCGRNKPANPRARDQKYCRDDACQSARKRDWFKRKMQQDPEFRQHQLQNQKDWRDEHPEHQSDYRKKHPKYVKKNRKQQKRRNAKRRRRSAITSITPELIVKLDASDSPRTYGYGERHALPLRIVKLDASTPLKPNVYLELETADQLVRIEAVIAQADVFFKPKATVR